MAGLGLLLAIALVLACESRGSAIDPTDGGPAPEWPEPPVSEAPDPEPPVRAEDVGPDEPVNTSARVEVAAREDGPPPVPPEPESPSRSLKERFETGDRFQRTVRIERRYQVRVESALAASAQGGSELFRSYTVNVDEALGGVIIRAGITVDRDERRALASDGRSRVTPPAEELVGLSLSCQLDMDGRYTCTPESEAMPRDLLGLIPQRLEMFPGRPAREGQTWEIRGDAAASFLELPNADVSVEFIFDAADADYGGQSCHHVSYTLAGNQTVELAGRTLPASLTGSGEYYLCRDRQVVLHHRQERRVTLEGPVIRRGTPTPVERTEEIRIEEETVFPSE